MDQLKCQFLEDDDKLVNIPYFTSIIFQAAEVCSATSVLCFK